VPEWASHLIAELDTGDDMMNKKLAKITKAHLEIQERHILNFWIFVDYEEGSSQGIGGICLDAFDDVKKKRVGSAYGCEMIRRLLLTLKVDDFSQMKGKMIWVYGEGEFLSFKPTGLSLLSVDDPKTQPLIFSDVVAEFGI
jgi:hypothetical protein